MWSKKFDKCIVCGTTSVPHHGKGMCHLCYSKYITKALGAKQEFTCLNCGKVFTPEWYSGIPRKFCCDKCSREYHTGRHRGVQPTREGVLTAMREAILSAGEYIPMPKLCRAAHICYDTLIKLGISRIEVYKGISVGQPVSLEDTAYYILSEYMPDLVINKVFDDCYSPKGKKLRFDLYSKQYNFLCEVDGEHHRNNTTQEYLQYFQQCDAMKEQYAKEKGITFVRIPVKRRQQVTKELIFEYLPEELSRTISSQGAATTVVAQGSTTSHDDVGSSDPKSRVCA